jgi:hypothetical protein
MLQRIGGTSLVRCSVVHVGIGGSAVPASVAGDVRLQEEKMRQSWKVYVVAMIVLVVSFVAAWTLPTTKILRGIIGLPGVGALFATLYQIVRDQAAHERAIELQEKQQLFNVGVASHMANVAFDKHVQFSEQYITRMQQGLTDLFQTGPPGESLKFCSDLIDILPGLDHQGARS